MKRLLTVFQKVEFLALPLAELYGSFVRLRVRSRVICVGFGLLIMCRIRRSRPPASLSHPLGNPYRGWGGVRVACRPATGLHPGSTDRGKPRRLSSLSLAGSKPYSPPAD